jgi:lysophospholipase L1-like esterase
VRATASVLLIALATAHAANAHAAAPDHWVGTWATAPVAQTSKTPDVGPLTLRQIVHVSLGGSTLRVVFTNEFGIEPLALSSASVALSAGNTASTIQSATARPLTFSGLAGIVIPAGAVAVSDPVAFTLAPLADLAITTVFPAQSVRTLTVHGGAQSSNFDSPGDQLSAATLTAPHTSTSWRFLQSVDVLAPQAAGAIVAFGDSITDGAHTTNNANARWPDVLARRLQGNKATGQLAVLNEGIGGNRVLHDGTGPNALARFDHDVLAQAGVRYLILLESINDIGHTFDPRQPTHNETVSANDLIVGFTQLARRAHTHGIKVFGATITPYGGAGYSSAAGEAMRVAVNQWIRTTPELDGFIDFDATTRDPANPTAFLPADDSGDHLHPSDAGYKAMGDSINLKLFR